MPPTQPSERLLKYPPMERQDLNQAQLGSFKFTPVDNIRSLTSIATKYLNQQLAQNLARASNPRTTDRTLNVPPSGHNTVDVASHLSNLQNHPRPTDPEFFNAHIKPHLGESRLQLGTAALRSAVEGAARSPVKKPPPEFDGVQTKTLFQDQIQHMDPNAASFVPTTAMSSPILPASSGSLNYPDSSTVNQSLCLALVNEQQAHNSTRLALTQEVQRCLELESQLKKNLQQISSLTATVNNLGAIIKYNVNKDAVTKEEASKKTDSLSVVEDADLKAFYRNHPRLRRSDEERKLHDAMQRQMEEAESTAQLTSIITEPVAALANAVKLDETQLFNLELLKDPKFDDSPASALRRTLRKHFAITDDNKTQDKLPVTPVKAPVNANKLIDISPDSPEGGEDNMDNKGIAKGSGLRGGHSDDKNREENGLGVSQVQTKPRLLTAENPVLQLPASFLAKYGRKSSSGEGPLQDQANQPQAEANIPDITNLQITVPGKVYAENTNVTSKDEKPGLPTRCVEDAVTTPTVVASSGSAPAAPVRLTVQLPGDFDGKPKWFVNKNNPVFADDAELMEAVAGADAAWVRNSPFVEHPVRYLPESAAATPNAYRTVMVDQIPLNTTLKDVLAIVRGGTLESIELHGPVGRATSFMTARIVFSYETAANTMYKQQEKVPFEINGSRVRTWKPIDPTYPCNGEIEEAIYGDEQATRILLLGGISDDDYAIIPLKLARLNLSGRVVEYSWTHDAYGSIEFTDVKSAFKAMRELKRDRELLGTIFRYDDDYTMSDY
ncbi:hypothetical protein LTR10_022840 [Elasticomyces elasticus]|nr:hypothetical protein LTR10_022840 [Elasticomyces elasticus]KAK5026180.1 hypothetical protein LTS07_007705 [Exophiala sideris]KAK5032434.1 hypothetical protein LTR13_007257 [Exophiala sideris]